jgi:hypothetical protein
MYQNTVENVSCPPVGAFLGPQRQAPYALASYCLRALGVRSETFFVRKRKLPSRCSHTAGLTGFQTSRREPQVCPVMVSSYSNSYAAPRALSCNCTRKT